MNPANEAAIQVVRDYSSAIDTIGAWRGYAFDELCYSRWSVNELLKCLEEQKSTPPLLVIENFLDKMEKYACLNKKYGFIFSYARDVTENIIDDLLSN